MNNRDTTTWGWHRGCWAKGLAHMITNSIKLEEIKVDSVFRMVFTLMQWLDYTNLYYRPRSLNLEFIPLHLAIGIKWQHTQGNWCTVFLCIQAISLPNNDVTGVFCIWKCSPRWLTVFLDLNSLYILKVYLHWTMMINVDMLFDEVTCIGRSRVLLSPIHHVVPVTGLRCELERC